MLKFFHHPVSFRRQCLQGLIQIDETWKGCEAAGLEGNQTLRVVMRNDQRNLLSMAGQCGVQSRGGVCGGHIM